MTFLLNARRPVILRTLIFSLGGAFALAAVFGGPGGTPLPDHLIGGVRGGANGHNKTNGDSCSKVNVDAYNAGHPGANWQPADNCAVMNATCLSCLPHAIWKLGGSAGNYDGNSPVQVTCNPSTNGIKGTCQVFGGMPVCNSGSGQYVCNVTVTEYQLQGPGGP